MLLCYSAQHTDHILYPLNLANAQHTVRILLFFVLFQNIPTISLEDFDFSSLRRGDLKYLVPSPPITHMCPLTHIVLDLITPTTLM